LREQRGRRGDEEEETTIGNIIMYDIVLRIELLLVFQIK
jgi:hypothetical protein